VQFGGKRPSQATPLDTTNSNSVSSADGAKSLDTSADTALAGQEIGSHENRSSMNISFAAPGLYGLVAQMLQESSALERLSLIKQALSAEDLPPDQHHKLSLEAERLEESRYILIHLSPDQEDPEVKKILSYLGATRFNYEPPKNDAEKIETLRSLPFFKDSYFEENPDLGRFLQLCIRGFDTLIEVPTTLISGAHGFDSWLGRGADGAGGKSGHKSSLDLILTYSKLDTPVPPVDEIILTVFSDGQAVLTTCESHRVAAAKLRQIPFIQTRVLTVTLVGTPFSHHHRSSD
jgi:hypothetical protein